MSRDYTLTPPRSDFIPTKGALKKYGITPEDYEILFTRQAGCCAICGGHQTKFKERLCVEHNHQTGHIRGLVCHYCNRKRLGSMGDNKKIWTRMMLYIARALEEDEAWHE